MRSQITSRHRIKPLHRMGQFDPPVRPPLAEETLVVDERASRRPAEAVEHRLRQMLGTSHIGVSQLRMKDLLSARSGKK